MIEQESPDRPTRPRRSILWVPGDQPRKLERAASAEADVVVLDLEDAVAPHRKAQARECVANALRDVNYGSSERMVRVNVGPLDSADIEVVATADAVCLPKVQGPEDLAVFRDLCLRVVGRVPPILAISAESPMGALSSHALVAASDDVVAWMWGSEDLAAALGIQGRGRGQGFPGPLELARNSTVLLAAATAAHAIDTVYPFYDDIAGLAAEAHRAASDGFSGKGIIHPAQVSAVHDAFTPSDEELERCRRVVDAFASGDGVATLDGQMLDLPHFRAAQRTLGRAPSATSVQSPGERGSNR